MIELKSRSALVWYAKGHYEKNSTMYDLAILISESYLLPIEVMRLSDIRQLMLNLCHDIGMFNESRTFFEFMSGITPERYYENLEGPPSLEYIFKPHPDYNFDKAVIGKCLRMLSVLKVMSGDEVLIDLEPVDYRVLRAPKND